MIFSAIYLQEHLPVALRARRNPACPGWVNNWRNAFQSLLSELLQRVVSAWHPSWWQWAYTWKRCCDWAAPPSLTEKLLSSLRKDGAKAFRPVHTRESLIGSIHAVRTIWPQEIVNQFLKLLVAYKGNPGSFLRDSNTTPVHLLKRNGLREQE